VAVSEPDPTVGTPADCSDRLYRVYVEVGEWQHIARDAITALLLDRSRVHPTFDFTPAALHVRPHGYEVDLPMTRPSARRARHRRWVGAEYVDRAGPRCVRRIARAARQSSLHGG
jgi:hypothetical protein